MDCALRPMTTSRLLDQTFHLYLRYFVLFAGIAVPASGIEPAFAFLQNVFPGGSNATVQSPGGAALWGLEMVLRFALRLLSSCMGYALAASATVQAVSAVHLGRGASVIGTYKLVRAKLGRVLKTAALSYILAFWPVLLGLSLLVAVYAALPPLMINMGMARAASALLYGAGLLLSLASFWCIYTLLRYSLAVAAATIENTSASGSLRRSKTLTKASLWRVLLIYLLTASFALALDYILQAPLYLVHDGTLTGSSGTPLKKWLFPLVSLSDFLTGVLAGPVATIALALLYYDQRVRIEAFDVELMMAAVEQKHGLPQAASQAGSQ